MNTEIFDLGKIGITLGYEYNDEVIYEKLTIVLYKGKSYISTKTTQGVSPEQDVKTWQLVAEAKDAYHMLIDAGKITLTEEEFFEQLVDATKGRYIVQGNIINAADEEDLTIEHSDLLGIDTLKLANRPSTNGMGYVILRKNKTFAEQVTKENTIYEIRYDFTLSEDITIPANCILKFNGGSISANGSRNTITLNNTNIESPITVVFKGIVLKGTCKEDIVLNYFDNPDDCVESAINLKKDIAVKSKIELNKPIILSGFLRLYGTNCCPKLSLKSEYNGIKAIVIIDAEKLASNIVIENLMFDGADYGIYRNGSTSLMTSKFRNLSFGNTIKISAFSFTGGFGCNTLEDITCQDINMTGDVISIQGSWANENFIKSSFFTGRARSVLSINCTNQLDNNYFQDNWLERLYLDYGVLNVNSTVGIEIFSISKCWFEQIWDRQEYGKESKTAKKGIININAGTGYRVNNLIFDKNTFSAYISYVADCNSCLANVIFKENQFSSISLLGIDAIIQGGDNVGFDLTESSNIGFNSTNSNVDTNNIKNVDYILSGSKELVRKLNNIKYLYFALQQNESKTVNIIPDNVTSFWSGDFQITTSAGKVVTGKIKNYQGHFGYAIVYSEDDNLIFTQLDLNGNVQITNSGPANEYKITSSCILQ